MTRKWCPGFSNAQHVFKPGLPSFRGACTVGPPEKRPEIDLWLTSRANSCSFAMYQLVVESTKTPSLRSTCVCGPAYEDLPSATSSTTHGSIVSGIRLLLQTVLLPRQRRRQILIPERVAAQAAVDTWQRLANNRRALRPVARPYL